MELFRSTERSRADKDLGKMLFNTNFKQQRGLLRGIRNTRAREQELRRAPSVRPIAGGVGAGVGGALSGLLGGR